MSIALIKSIKDIQPYIKEIQGNFRNGFNEAYRGQASNKYELVSGIGRTDKPLEETLGYEKKLLEKFKLSISSIYSDLLQESTPALTQPFSRVWHHLFQAQHLRLKTRLLDWTIKWEYALLFAVEDETYFGEDGQLWVFKCPKSSYLTGNKLSLIYNFNPVDISGSFLINPYFNENYQNFVGETNRFKQFGRFTIQSSSLLKTPLEKQPTFRKHLTKFIIDGDSKSKIKSELEEQGYNMDSILFEPPDPVKKKIEELNNELT